jgi:hypothetical protein
VVIVFGQINRSYQLFAAYMAFSDGGVKGLDMGYAKHMSRQPVRFMKIITIGLCALACVMYHPKVRISPNRFVAGL